MSRQIRYHLWHLGLWLVVTIGFLAVFTRAGTIVEWGDNPRKTIMVAILILIGFAGDAVLRFVFREKKEAVTLDERDLGIQHKGLSIAFVLVLLYAFLLSVTLYSNYEATGMVPVGWLWFNAYSLILAAHVFSSVAVLIIYWKEGR